MVLLRGVSCCLEKVVGGLISALPPCCTFSFSAKKTDLLLKAVCTLARRGLEYPCGRFLVSAPFTCHMEATFPPKLKDKVPCQTKSPARSLACSGVHTGQGPGITGRLYRLTVNNLFACLEVKANVQVLLAIFWVKGGGLSLGTSD